MQSGAFSDSFEQFFKVNRNHILLIKNKVVKHILDRILLVITIKYLGKYVFFFYIFHIIL